MAWRNASDCCNFGHDYLWQKADRGGVFGTTLGTIFFDGYRPVTDSWTQGPNLPVTAEYPSGASIDGKGYRFAGSGQYCHEYDDSAWTVKTAMPPPGRFNAGAAAVDGSAYVIAGWNTGVVGIDDNDEYTPATDSWVSKTSMPPTTLVGHQSVDVGGVIVSYGGGSITQPTKLYTPATDSWAEGVDITQFGEQAGYSLGGLAYFAGGNTSSLGVVTYRKDQFVYDLDLDTWSATAQMPEGRRAPTGFVAMDFGHVVTGSNASGNQQSNYQYDPLSDSWATKTDSIFARSRGAAFTLPI